MVSSPVVFRGLLSPEDSGNIYEKAAYLFSHTAGASRWVCKAAALPHC